MIMAIAPRRKPRSGRARPRHQRHCSDFTVSVTWSPPRAVWCCSRAPADGAGPGRPRPGVHVNVRVGSRVLDNAYDAGPQLSLSSVRVRMFIASNVYVPQI